jgi:hypothetical protein
VTRQPAGIPRLKLQQYRRVSQFRRVSIGLARIAQNHRTAVTHAAIVRSFTV